MRKRMMRRCSTLAPGVRAPLVLLLLLFILSAASAESAGASAAAASAAAASVASAAAAAVAAAEASTSMPAADGMPASTTTATSDTSMAAATDRGVLPASSDADARAQQEALLATASSADPDPPPPPTTTTPSLVCTDVSVTLPEPGNALCDEAASVPANAVAAAPQGVEYTLSPAGPYAIGSHVITASVASSPDSPISCSFTFNVLPCPMLRCHNLVRTLDRADGGGCDGATVDFSEFYESIPPASPGPGAHAYGPGIHPVSVSTLVGPTYYCTANLTVIPCTPACSLTPLIVVGTTPDSCRVELSSSPPLHQALLDPATVSNLVQPATSTGSPPAPYRLGANAASLTLTYADYWGEVSTTSPVCAFQVKDLQPPNVTAVTSCIAPKNSSGTFERTSACFSTSELAPGSDNCSGTKLRYTVTSCRNLAPVLPLRAPNPCFYGGTLVCVNLKNAPRPANSGKRIIQVGLTVSDWYGNKVTVVSYIHINYAPNPSCKSV